MKTVGQFRREHKIQLQSISNPITLHQALVYGGHRKMSERSTRSPQDAVRKLAERLGLDCGGIDWDLRGS